MFRFKLRTLLIATALICVFLGLQVHVHMKAKRFVEEMSNKTSPNGRPFRTTVAPLSLADVFRFARRCEITFVTESSSLRNTYIQITRIKYLDQVYQINSFGKAHRLDQMWSVAEETTNILPTE